jgi:multiple sugar transport system permease protein
MRPRNTSRTYLVGAARALGIIAVVAFVLGPIYVVFVTSVTSQVQLLSSRPTWLPYPHLGDYREILSYWNQNAASAPNAAATVMPAVWNSLKVAVAVGVANLLLGTSAGYAIARLRFPGRNALSLGILATQMIPSLAFMVPFFILMRQFGLIDSLNGIILADLSITLPFTIWIIRASVEDVPRDLEQAARVDGCSRFRTFVTIIVPLIRPGLVTAGLFAFLTSWNDLIYPLVLIVSPQNQMIQPTLSAFYHKQLTNFGFMTAGSVIAAVPVIIVGVVTVRTIVRGLLAGAVKG